MKTETTADNEADQRKNSFLTMPINWPGEERSPLKLAYEDLSGETKNAEARKNPNNDGKRTDLQIQDDLEYADDTQLCIAIDNREQMCERMGNYDISTETRERVRYNW